MITTTEELIEALENEIIEQKRRLKDGWYKDDYIPLDLYGCSMRIVREVIKLHPEYLRHWPSLEDYIK